ncbi:MAG: DUF192 domain-containing protein [Candidatus Margulisiibacteriota bacterium]|nr:DUF192 domain-containing protein [Candidatus Margulisiibacteriota bacterium]
MFLLAFAIFMGSFITPPHSATVPQFEYKVIHARIGSKVYELDVADSILKQHIGLSYRKELKKGRGMFFLFDKPEIHEFCMVDMYFPLDLAWIRENKVVTIMENVPVTKKRRMELKDNEILKPTQPADKVIELNAGEIKKNRLKTGDIILIL